MSPGPGVGIPKLTLPPQLLLVCPWAVHAYHPDTSGYDDDDVIADIWEKTPQKSNYLRIIVEIIIITM